jgi:hypothetical protein
VAPDVVADDLLGMAPGIEVGGVDEVATEVDEAVNDLFGLLDAGTPTQVFAERHRPQAQRADAQTGSSECHVVIQRHGRPLSVRLFTYTFV